MAAEEFAESVRRALTPAERDLFEAHVLGGERLHEYAKRRGRKRKTVYNQKASMTKKAEALKGLLKSG
jgi:transposase